MKRWYTILVSILVVLFTSCAQEEIGRELLEENGEVSITAAVSPLNSTRLAVDHAGKGQFTEGDNIQLFVLSENNPAPSYANMYSLTLEKGGWKPVLEWEQLDGAKPDFVAYYPLLNRSGGNYEVQVSYDQHLSGNQAKADLLRAETSAVRGEKVHLEFKHIMNRLSVKLSSNYFTETDFAKADIRVYAATKASIDPKTGRITKVNYSSLQKRIRLAYAGNGEFQAVLIPQEVLEEWKNTTPWITVSVAGKHKEIMAPKTLSDGTPFNVLEPGKEVTLNVALNKEGVDVWANQIRWVYGIHNPPVEDRTKWGYAFVYKDWTILGLSWNRSYGWYDCNKVDPVDPGHPAHDSNLCWAAACSNLLHWYMEQNAEYISRFGYKGPQKYPNSLESEIFQHYKDNFENEGYYVTNGLNWFFTGRDGNVERPNGGFFKKVFGISSVLRSEKYDIQDITNKKRFNDAIKQAFRDREAIQVSFLLPPYGASAHAITVWGAGFDAEGIINELYVVENNDIDWEKQEEREDPKYDRKLVPAGIFRKPIAYKDGYVYMEGAKKDAFTMRVESLVFLGLHKDKWEEYFSQNQVSAL